ncbi:MAG: zinc-binding dehydrogenase [Actinomycetia bacterium]|nr:zinc-binding dehydrogenase [Actinomycetes bacterium]MCP4222579.1 zinc-binding dehydrogenase [Actinomycetes bacterium]MCP5031728.1 zinc-binding dehydrogenase [Actinomycetes bacterium]
MRAAVLRQGAMVVDDVPDLDPGPGQVLVETIACGICGSDLHTVGHAHEMASTAREAGIATFNFDPDHDLVMGHEISVRVLDTGSDVEDVAAGAIMAAMPVLTTTDGGLAVPGYDNTYPGGYSERMLLDPGALVPVPNGLDPVLAALTEPLAVGLHAVNQSGATKGRPAIVIGAGPVGLAVVSALALVGAEPIIVSDFSSKRREMALAMGASIVVDPSGAPSRRESFGVAVDALSDEASGETPPTIFEAVGVPGMIDAIMSGAPNNSEIMVVGVCMQDDDFRPIMGIYKRLSLRFVLGWTPAEFAQSLQNMADGRIQGETLITGHVDLDGVPDAFDALADPDQHVKIMVRPNGTS